MGYISDKGINIKLLEPVYIRIKRDINIDVISQWISINENWRKILELVAKKILPPEEWGCAKKVRMHILKEANRLLMAKKSISDSERTYLFKTKVSIKQLKTLNKSKGSKFTCHAGVILMAIFNLIYDTGDDTSDFREIFIRVMKECESNNYQQMVFGLRYENIIRTYRNAGFKGIQKELAGFLSKCDTAISEHNRNDCFSNTTHILPLTTDKARKIKVFRLSILPLQSLLVFVWSRFCNRG